MTQPPAQAAQTLEASCISSWVAVNAATKTYASFSSEVDMSNVQASKLPTDAAGQQALLQQLAATLAQAANLPVKSIKIVDVTKPVRTMGWRSASALVTKTLKRR